MLNKKIFSKLYTWIWEVGVKYGFEDVCLRLENEIINVENCLPVVFGKGKQASLLRAARNVQIILTSLELNEYITDKIRGFVKIIASLLQDSQLYSNDELIIPLLCFHQTSMLLIFSETKVHRNDVLSIKQPYDIQWEIVKNYFHFKDDRYKEDVIKISEKGFEIKQELMDGSSRSPGFEEELETYYYKWKIFEKTLMKSLPIPQLQEICNENREEECFAFPEANKFLQIIQGQGSSNFTSKKLHQLIESLNQDSYSPSSPPVSMNNSSLVIELDLNVLKSKQSSEPKAKSPSEEVQYTNITRSQSIEDDITRSGNNESDSAKTHCKNVNNETYDIIELKEDELWKIRNLCYKNGNYSSGNENQRHHSPKEVFEIQICKDFESQWKETVPITKLDSDIFNVDKVINKLKWMVIELEKKAKSLKSVKDKLDIENWLVSQNQMEGEAVSEEYEYDTKAFENEKVALTLFDNAKFNEISFGVSTMSFEDNQIRSLESPGENATLGPLYTENNPTSGLQDQVKITTGGPIYKEENSSGNLLYTEENNSSGRLDTQEDTTDCPMNAEKNAAGGPLDAEENITGCLMDTEKNTTGDSLETEGYISDNPMDVEENTTAGPLDTGGNISGCSMDMVNNTDGPLNVEVNISSSPMNERDNTTGGPLEEKCSNSCAEMSEPESNYSNEDISLSFTNNDNLDIHFGGDKAQGTSDFVTRRNIRQQKNINLNSDPQIKVNEMNIKSSPMSSSARGSSISSNRSKSPPILSPQVKVGGCSNRSQQTFRSQDKVDDFYDESPPILSPQGKIDDLGGVSVRVGGRKNKSSQSLKLQERVSDLDIDSLQICSPPRKIDCRNKDSKSTQVKVGSRNKESQQIKKDLKFGPKSSYVRLSPLNSSLLRKVTRDDSTNSPDKKKDYLSPVSAKSSKRKPKISESSMKKSCQRSSSCRKILKAKSRSCSDLRANSSESGATSPLSSSKGVATIRKRKLNLHVSLGAEGKEVVFLKKVFAPNQNKESSEEKYFTPKSDLSVAQRCKQELQNSSSTTQKTGKSKKKKKPKRKSTTPRTEN